MMDEYGERLIEQGRRLEREEISNYLQSIINSVPLMNETKAEGIRTARDAIKARGAVKPVKIETATATQPKIKFCDSCGTAIGVEETQPVKPGKIARVKMWDDENRCKSVSLFDLADRLNELIDRANEGK